MGIDVDAIAYRLALGLDSDDEDFMEDAAGVDDNTDIQKRNTAVSTNSSAQKSTHSRSISNMRDEQEDAGMAIDSFT